MEELMRFLFIVWGVTIIIVFVICPILVLADFRWYRKWRGGRWERWWIDDVHCFAWFQNDGPERPHPLCRGTPVVEDYRDPIN